MPDPTDHDIPPQLSSGGQKFPLPPGFAEKLLGDPQNPPAFVRGLREISADAQNSGAFATIVSIIKAIRWLLILAFSALAISCVIGAFALREAQVLLLPAFILGLFVWFLLCFSSKR